MKHKKTSFSQKFPTKWRRFDTIDPQVRMNRLEILLTKSSQGCCAQLLDTY